MITSKFVLGGKAIFTVDNGKGEHFTYKINKHKHDDIYFANVLSGSDGAYSYMGVFDKNTFNVYKGAKGMNSSAKSVRVLEWAMRVIKGDTMLPDGYDIMHEGMCGRCGRQLTDPESIKCGFGSTCKNK